MEFSAVYPDGLTDPHYWWVVSHRNGFYVVWTGLPVVRLEGSNLDKRMSTLIHECHEYTFPNHQAGAGYGEIQAYMYQVCLHGYDQWVPPHKPGGHCPEKPLILLSER